MRTSQGKRRQRAEARAHLDDWPHHMFHAADGPGAEIWVGALLLILRAAGVPAARVLLAQAAFDSARTAVRENADTDPDTDPDVYSAEADRWVEIERGMITPQLADDPAERKTGRKKANDLLADLYRRRSH